MATLVFSALGTLVGGPLGGAIGALVGRQVDGAILGGPSRPGPRLKELSVTTSSYGTPLPRHFGRMRVAGTIIWATDLVEQRETQGGGKGRPSSTKFTYTASFAVALASRPIGAIGRIWADGNLLRGAAGDLKTNGTIRIYDGHGDQDPDPLIAELEGLELCPAYRGLAYVVFEDLELADFFNRIPALTFEVIADEAFSLQQIVGEIIPDADADLPLDGIAGFSCEGSLIDTLATLEPVFALDADAGGERLTIARERLQIDVLALPEPAISVADDDFGGASGQARKRSPVRQSPPEVLRYYEVDRDYLPGIQRATGRRATGQPLTVELPAAMSAATARNLIERAARRSDWSRDRIAWRTSQLDPAVAPGAIVALPDRAGRWRVREWEWRESGVELSLERVVPTGAESAAGSDADEGRANPPLDLPASATVLHAFELPWDGIGSGDMPLVHAAVSSAGANWSGAALYVDPGDASLTPLGGSGRIRSIVGTALTALPPSSPLLVDRAGSVVVELIADDLDLADATIRQLAAGANRALIGEEIVQFASALPLGANQWQLSTLLRGRGGTESAAAGHTAGEPFVLLDGRPVALDPAIIGTVEIPMIAAVGRADEEPVLSDIALRGITLRPLNPVHARFHEAADGTLTIEWTRRSRGAWLWTDGVDAPLNEQAERYIVTFGSVAAPLAIWSVEAPSLELAPHIRDELVALQPDGTLHVRQQGSLGLSEPLFLLSL